MRRPLYLLVPSIAWLFPANAPAQCPAPVDSVLTLGSTYVRTPFDVLLEAPTGSEVPYLLFGFVSQAKAPLDQVPVHQLGVEITFLIRDLAYEGSILWDSSDGQYGGYAHEFENGILQIFYDETPDANLSVPASFGDGEVLLSGHVTRYYIGFQDCYLCRVDGVAWFTVTGGILFPRASRDGIGFNGSLIHYHSWSSLPDSLRDLRLQFQGDGRLNLCVPVAVQPSTWGQLKRRYLSTR